MTLLSWGDETEGRWGSVTVGVDVVALGYRWEDHNRERNLTILFGPAAVFVGWFR